jgi:diphthamide biosynthesis protein 2
MSPFSILCFPNVPLSIINISWIGNGNLGTSLLTSGITDLSLRNNETALSSLLESPSGAFLKSRTFRGLEQNTGEHEASLVEEGRSGIARGYSTEKDLNSSTT